RQHAGQPSRFVGGARRLPHSALATVSAHYGSLAHYLSAVLDLTDAQVARLRQLYLLPAAD
uniref:tyrosine-protein phosphatase n=1 Tax=Lacticaseibacillus nasuensis TaxID=944671 RepID=UPI000A74294E